MLDEQGPGRIVDVDGVASLGLGGHQDGSVLTFNPAGTERDLVMVDIDIPPAQPEQLSTTSTGGGSENQQQMECRIRRQRAHARPHHDSHGRCASGTACDQNPAPCPRTPATPTGPAGAPA
jgi:hypothetical protein